MSSDFSQLIASWSAEIAEIQKTVDEWSGKVIIIEVNQRDMNKNEKFQRFKAQCDKFKETMNKRLSGLRSKIINTLKGIYQTARARLEPYATIASLLTNLSPDPTAIVNALKKVGEQYLAMYTEPYEVTLQVIQLASQVVALTSSLASMSVPTVQFKDGSTWKPDPPTFEPISIGEIIG